MTTIGWSSNSGHPTQLSAHSGCLGVGTNRISAERLRYSLHFPAMGTIAGWEGFDRGLQQLAGLRAFRVAGLDH